MRLLITCILLVLVIDYNAAMWIKKYSENYHRPTYYNRGHSSKDHVDYNREALEERDKPPPVKSRSVSPFSAERDLSYYVHVLNRGSVICSGAMISRRMVITSSHCFTPPGTDAAYEFTAKRMSILTGIEFTPGKSPHMLIAFFMPVNKDESLANHVALLALAQKLERDTFRYIPLNRKRPHVGDDVKMAYVGPPNYQIRHYKTRVLDFDRCKVYYSLKELFHVSVFEQNFFCVRNKRHSKKTTCSTRPGDPLVVDDKLVGINIYGEHCDEDDDSTNMDIYIPIRVVIPFIQTATDALRAFTASGPFNESLPTTLTPLIQSLADKKPNIYVGDHVREIQFDDPLNGGPDDDGRASNEHHAIMIPDYY
ncbi:kallikrein 1-related peptidase b21 [Drosophila eugracilis]|uniref:kallikrein 1-related peptidase b21 n=1 Tax=Drosophila eugracilis TaxID=29029 RepID=UPI0007E893EF|nr:kallikrein 1-related peptidase b21 [Drosophila eugracilis]